VSTMVVELYEALKRAGIDDTAARDAARAVLGVEQRADLATKADVAALGLATKAELADMESRLTWKVVTLLGYVTVIYTAINAALRFIKL